MQIDLLGGSYEQKYADFNSQRTINWYVVPGLPAAQDKTKVALFPTPGQIEFVDTEGTNLRCIYTARLLTSERAFTVVDQTLYEINSNGTVTSRGSLSDITNNATTIFMANSSTQLFIGHSSASYIFTFATNGLAKITDGEYPGMEYVTYMHGYFIVVKDGRIYYSALNDGSDWTGTDTVTPTFKGDGVKAALAHKDDLLCYGSETIEVYVHDGSTPFSQQGRATTEIGLHAVESLAADKSGTYFLGKTKSGQAAVYMMNDSYQVEQISPFSITWAINNTSSSTSDAYGYIQYTKDGHVWYYLTVPAINTTFVYDITTQSWQERQSKNPSNSDYAEFRGRYFTNFGGVNLFADLYSGKILQESFTTFTEDGEPIKRIRTSRNFNTEYQYISVYSLEFDTKNLYNVSLSVEPNDPVMQLEYSIDGGKNFINYGNLKLREGANPGDIDHRTRAHKLGTGLNWVIRITLTDAIDLAIFNAVAHGVVASA